LVKNATFQFKSSRIEKTLQTSKNLVSKEQSFWFPLPYIGVYLPKPIYCLNNPGEASVLGCINHTNTIDAAGFDVRNTAYIKFRGLTIRNEHQEITGQWIAIMQFYQNGNLYLDRINCHSVGGGPCVLDSMHIQKHRLLIKQ
jgi:hypothetical protein